MIISGGDVRNKFFLFITTIWLAFGSLLCSYYPSTAIAAPAANCPDLITASNQAFSQAGTSISTAENAYNVEYKKTGDVFPAIQAGTRARTSLSVSLEATRQLATNDCGESEYNRKKLALSTLVERFNTLRNGATTQYQDNITAISTTDASLPDYQSLASNPAQGDCIGLSAKASQQYAALLPAIDNGHARAGDWTNAQSLAAAQPTIDTIKSGYAQLSNTVQQMKDKGCTPKQIEDADALLTKVQTEVTKIEQEHNATQNSILGQGAAVADKVGAFFSSCAKCQDIPKVLVGVDQMIQGLCCLLFSFVKAATEASAKIAAQVATYAAKY